MKCRVNQESLCKAEGGLHVVFCNAILMGTTSTIETDSLVMCIEICLELCRRENTIVSMETLDRMPNGTGFFVNNTFALQSFTTAEGNLVECKDHLGCMICEHGATIVHGTGIRSSAKSPTFVFDHVLIKRHPITSAQIFSGEFIKLCSFSMCGAVQDLMYLGKHAGCILGNWARASPWLLRSHNTWVL
eukprot:14922648-Ditylum_brightwellii.AAC.1